MAGRNKTDAEQSQTAPANQQRISQRSRKIIRVRSHDNRGPLPDKGLTPTTTIISEIPGKPSTRLTYKRNHLTLQMEYSMIMELAFALEKQGISAFRFDFSGNGESEGSLQFGNYRKEVDDLHTVIQHFTAANRVICAILGHSKGGNVVVLYASSHHDIPIVVNVSGRYKMDRGIEERLGKDYSERAKRDGYIDIKSEKGKVLFRATEESILERLNTNMHEAGLKIDKDCKVLTVHGSEDKLIPVEDAFEFAKIIPNHTLQIIEGANHGYDKHQDELASAILAFIKANMHRV
ncbi:alpha/beta hydrolase fold protein [Tanacetum coccineum]|uniref:Alpha/beta hydrolase fold protein n=1 Tax=Tanacetum coccineum TaxID=301880 RepID=A0ABQ5AYD5_9ASTR